MRIQTRAGGGVLEYFTPARRMSVYTPRRGPRPNVVFLFLRQFFSVSLSVEKCMFSVPLLLGGEDSVVFVSPASFFIIPIWFKAVRVKQSSTDDQLHGWRQRLYTRSLFQLNGNVTHTLSGLRKRVTG